MQIRELWECRSIWKATGRVQQRRPGLRWRLLQGPYDRCYWKGAAEKARAEVEVTARAIRQMPGVKSLVERCGKAMG